MPSKKVNSILEVDETSSESAAADVSKTVVGNLETEATEQAKESEDAAIVTVTMTVKKQAASDADEGQTAIEEEMSTKEPDSEEKALEFLEITVKKEVKTTDSTETSNVLSTEG